MPRVVIGGVVRDLVVLLIDVTDEIISRIENRQVIKLIIMCNYESFIITSSD